MDGLRHRSQEDPISTSGPIPMTFRLCTSLLQTAPVLPWGPTYHRISQGDLYQCTLVALPGCSDQAEGNRQL